MLYKHFKKQVYVLIDEYAVPLAKTQANGYHKDMVTLMSSFLGFLKDPQKDPEKKTSIISKVVITGCLKVAKNSIFTGVNNLTVNTVISTDCGSVRDCRVKPDNDKVCVVEQLLYSIR